MLLLVYIIYSRFSFLINNIQIQFINYLVFDKSMLCNMHIIKTFYIFFKLDFILKVFQTQNQNSH